MSVSVTCHCGHRWEPSPAARVVDCPHCGATLVQPAAGPLTPSHIPGQATITLRKLGEALPDEDLSYRPTIPGYEIEGVLGRGGMGVVYKARHLALKRTVALKMIIAGGHAGSEARARFKAEAEAVARLSHPNIVQIHEVGEHQGLPFCALEFVDGGNLAQHLSDKAL